MSHLCQLNYYRKICTLIKSLLYHIIKKRNFKYYVTISLFCYLILVNGFYSIKALQPLESTSARTISMENCKHIYFCKVNFSYRFWLERIKIIVLSNFPLLILSEKILVQANMEYIIKCTHIQLFSGNQHKLR